MSLRKRRSRVRAPRLGLLQTVQDDPVVHELAQGNSPERSAWTWQPVTTLLDSGAARSVCPQSFCAHVPTVDSEASKRGQLFRTAGGELIQNRGERTIKGYTADSVPIGMRYAVTDVQVPLDSISQICDGGATVTFSN